MSAEKQSNAPAIRPMLKEKYDFCVGILGHQAGNLP